MATITLSEKLRQIYKFTCGAAPNVSFVYELQPAGIRLRAWTNSERPTVNHTLTWEELEKATRAEIQKAIQQTLAKAKA